jgi:hypothetical protein
MRPAGLEPTIPASERLQTHVLDRAATGIGYRGIPSPSSERPRYNFHACHIKRNHRLWIKNVLLEYACLHVSVHVISIISAAQQLKVTYATYMNNSSGRWDVVYNFKPGELIQGGAEETHVFHIRITLFIFNIKKF